MRAVGHALWDRCAGAPVLLQDALLYLCSSGFALLTAVYAVSSDYRTWGSIAGVVYFVAGAACLLANRSLRFALPSLLSTFRRGVVVVALLGAVIAPLGAEVAWRAEALPGAHAQPEVAVIERAADRVVQGESPYLAAPTNVGVSPRSDSHAVDDASYFPYLPGMVPFGLLNTVGLPAALGDARVSMVLFTLAVVALALAISGAPGRRRGRVWQFLVVLPWGALPLVTGGDDLPVLALLLLGLVLGARRYPLAAGAVLGLAATLKFTAWPIVALMALAARDRDDRPAPFRYGAAVLCVALPIVLIGYLSAPAAFVENVIRFPLGLAKAQSPAASPLLGQVITHVLPGDRKLVTALLLALGVGIVVAVGRRHVPRTPAEVAGFTAFALLVATVLAPATRFGYLIYPANLLAFYYLLRAVAPARARAIQPSSATSKIRSSTLLDAVAASPARAGVIDGLAGSTTTPTSQ